MVYIHIFRSALLEIAFRSVNFIFSLQSEYIFHFLCSANVFSQFIQMFKSHIFVGQSHHTARMCCACLVSACVPLVCGKEDERHITVSNLFHYNGNMINTRLTCIVHIYKTGFYRRCVWMYVRCCVVVLVSRFALTIANERRTGNLLRNVIWFRFVFFLFRFSFCWKKPWCYFAQVFLPMSSCVHVLWSHIEHKFKLVVAVYCRRFTVQFCLQWDHFNHLVVRCVTVVVGLEKCFSLNLHRFFSLSKWVIFLPLLKYV